MVLGYLHFLVPCDQDEKSAAASLKSYSHSGVFVVVNLTHWVLYYFLSLSDPGLLRGFAADSSSLKVLCSGTDVSPLHILCLLAFPHGNGESVDMVHE